MIIGKNSIKHLTYRTFPYIMDISLLHSRGIVMRCKYCGSANISTETQQTTGFSYKKGILGTLFFGPIGAVAGIGGKTKTQKQYRCMACGTSGNISEVTMDPKEQAMIDCALQYRETEKLQKSAPKSPDCPGH